MQAELVPTCRELGVGIVAYSPLSRGMLSGRIGSSDLHADDSRLTRFPRYRNQISIFKGLASHVV